MTLSQILNSRSHPISRPLGLAMGLLPDTKNWGLRMRRECFHRHPLQRKPRSGHASRHVRYTRAMMHVGIANPWWRQKHSRRMRIPQFTYLAKGPWGVYCELSGKKWPWYIENALYIYIYVPSPCRTWGRVLWPPPGSGGTRQRPARFTSAARLILSSFIGAVGRVHTLTRTANTHTLAPPAPATHGKYNR